LNLDVNYDKEAGTLIVKDGNTEVLRAIQKGRGQMPWLAIFTDSENIKWGPM
jgi:hypothetical protein